MRGPPSRHASSTPVHDERRRAGLVARLVRAAASLDHDDAVALAQEALPFDNEALAFAERRDPAASPREGRGGS